MSRQTENEHPLKAYRRENNLTQQALADLVGTTHVTISRLESGERNITTVMARKIVAALDGAISYEALLSWTPQTSEAAD